MDYKNTSSLERPVDPVMTFDLVAAVCLGGGQRRGPVLPEDLRPPVPAPPNTTTKTSTTRSD